MEGTITQLIRPSKVIKQEMKKRGLTQKDIALIIGKSESYVSGNLLKEKN